MPIIFTERILIRWNWDVYLMSHLKKDKLLTRNSQNIKCCLFSSVAGKISKKINIINFKCHHYWLKGIYGYATVVFLIESGISISGVNENYYPSSNEIWHLLISWAYRVSEENKMHRRESMLLFLKLDNVVYFFCNLQDFQTLLFQWLSYFSDI